MSDCLNDPLEFATKFSELPIPEARRLEFRKAEQLIKQQHLHKDGKIALDYGCGTGYSTIFLNSLGFDTDGVDVNKYMIERAQQLNSGAKYSVIKSGEIPQNDNHYNLVFACWVLGYIDKKESLLKVCTEIVRVLKNGGTLIAIVDCETSYNTESETYNTKFEENKNSQSGTVRKTEFKHNNFVMYTYYWSEDDYREVFAQAGLTIVCEEKPIEDSDCKTCEKRDPYMTVFVAQKL